MLVLSQTCPSSYTLQIPARLILVSCSPPSRRLVLQALPAFGPSFSAFLISKLYCVIIHNRSPFSADALRSTPMPCSSSRYPGCALQIPARLVLLFLQFSHHKHALRSILLSFRFLQTPITTPSDPRVQLGFFLVLVLQALHHQFTNVWSSYYCSVISQSLIDIILISPLLCRPPSSLHSIPVSCPSFSLSCPFGSATPTHTLGPSLSALLQYTGVGI